jgi:hypothetical protein
MVTGRSSEIYRNKNRIKRRTRYTATTARKRQGYVAFIAWRTIKWRRSAIWCPANALQRREDVADYPDKSPPLCHFRDQGNPRTRHCLSPS